MRIHQDVRDLAKVATYFIAATVILSSVAYGSVAALRELSDTPFLSWATAASEPSEKPLTRLDSVVNNAREIRAALEKPIPRAEPLSPITAKLAYGHLKPGGNGATAVAAITVNAQRKLKIPKAAMNAMAMDTSTSFGSQASSAVRADLHKVY